jgi:hypothetical protein
MQAEIYSILPQASHQTFTPTANKEHRWDIVHKNTNWLSKTCCYNLRVFWDMMLCQSLNGYSHFREACCFHLQGLRSLPRLLIAQCPVPEHLQLHEHGF